MTKLPEPDWIALSESLRRASQAFDVELSAVETALVAAFHDGDISTRGRCRTYCGHDVLHRLDMGTWDRARAVWEANEFTIPSDQVGRKIHIFSDVVVHREALEKWINSAAPDSQHGHQETVEIAVPEDEPVSPRKKPTDPDTSNDTGNQKSKPANSRRGNPNFTRGPYYEPLKKCLRSRAKLLKKRGESLCYWFEGLSRKEFRELVKPALAACRT